jgi:MFS transporter, MHS family, citrate/tricarballylate:H+ symporter
MTTPVRKSKVWTVVQVSSGNFLEMYDFMVFGYYASAIGVTFFPKNEPFVGLMLSLMTFGVGFLVRPLGAIVLGAYTDRHGRRAGLILTLGLMSIGILSVSCVPDYATIGILAPIPVVTGRLLQGFSAGMGSLSRKWLPFSCANSSFFLARNQCYSVCFGSSPRHRIVPART